ncbi:hypothetical protein HJG60_012705 [Phyllostomus discolor]|uniref:non-specific serine/threonine protein kinase n=1 Tax=Phyllostomus discolor TaxID=89673 RepID=A0A834DJE6_9CHIR|nr:hypothetical protein HJG60_012705 [Phyllostomus discolor]
MSSDSAALSASEECLVAGYVLLSPIGRGAFSKVVLARHLVTGTEVAVKIIKKGGFAKVSQEAHVLMSLNHPNIITLFQVIDTQDRAFLFLEHVSRGHLFGYLRKNGPLAEEDARAKFRQMTSAVQYCHRKGVAHRDLKPGNILLDGENNIKLADFGLSTFSDDKLPVIGGTVSYVAPEVLRLEPCDSRKADAWSLGVILYRMVTGKLPFESTNFEERKQKILTGHFHIPDTVSLECQELLKKLLTLDPSHRITVEGVMDDQWMNIGYEEALRPYSEPPGGDIDPRVIERMEKLGYKKEDIEDSVSQRKYDDIMGTYMILKNTQTKMVGRTIRVRPCPNPVSNISLHATQEALAFEQKSEKCSSLPCYMQARVPSPQGRLHRSLNTPPAFLDAKTTSSLPSPALQRGPGGSCLPASETDAGTPGSPSGRRHGQQGVAKRILRFFLKCICCRPSTEKQHHKKIRAKPI